jgi:hypothetical protein
MPLTPTTDAPKITATTQIHYWPDRIRLAWAVLCGRRFSLSIYVDDVTVSRPTPEAKERT